MSRRGKQATTDAATPSRVRTSRNSSRGRDEAFLSNRFDHQLHFDRWKGLENLDIMHERIVRLNGEEEPIFRNCILGLGWRFMYDDLVRINVSVVRELCANFSSAKQDHVFLQGKRIPFTEANICDERSARGVGTRGVQIDYAASKDGARQKMSCHNSLQPIQKYRVWNSGRSPNELAQGTILVVRKTGVAIVSVSKWKLKERYRDKLIKRC
ncbi:hypothetical protein PIB30_020372 [Stylosanthes scabra]|uniref:Uncharacterized protein n=1 Tax=Stylosanthes scabra TaxID=79078 RepID=A0ABU6Q966_9FABA|nr:hypothetical protein [Stylosanthes scabra]